MKTIIYLVLLSTLMFSCTKELDQAPESSATRENVFSNQKGLEAYSYSFYKILPKANDFIRGDRMTDYGAVKEVDPFIKKNSYSASQSTGWKKEDWEDLRNLNFFITNCVDPRVPESTRKEYIALARFFRAWFYFNKVKRFGDVPWVNYPMNIDDQELFGKRDSRFLVMDSVLADIDYACKHIALRKDDTRTLITHAVALGLKSRICLYEGSLRRYQTKYKQQATAEKWFAEAASAAKALMEEGDFKLYAGHGTDMSYRMLFISEKPVADEIMLSAVCDPALAVYNDANWWYTSSTYGLKLNFTRTYINTYLQIDGTPFTNIPGYQTMSFMEEVKHRDKRLQQSIRMGDYTRIDLGKVVPAPPVFSYTLTGYQPIKWCMDDTYYDSGTRNVNSISLMRYAEVLLNYAEAKAELGTFTDEDWAETIGALRNRAGITGGTDTKPLTVDSYFQANYFPEISDPVLLEIRRERAIELSLEGFRFDDIVRWHKGELMTKEWNGMYVPALDVVMDLNEDGIGDVCFVMKVPASGDQQKGVSYVNVSDPQQVLANGTSGEIIWLNTVPRTWEEKNYLYPIPETDRLINPNLGQNEGW